MRKVLISLISILTLLGATGPASAEEKSVTLREAIELGLKGSPELKAFHNSVYAEKETDFAIQDLNNPAAINDYQTSISVEQPLFVRKANVGLGMAKEEYSASLVDLTRKKEEVAFNIVRTYLMVNTAGEFVDVANKGIEDAKEHLRLEGQLQGRGGSGVPGRA